MSVRTGKVNPDKFTIYPKAYIFNGEDDSELVSVCLNKSFIRMLQSQSGRYEWWGSYRTTGDSGERVELESGEIELIQRGIYQLFFGLVDGCAEPPPPPPPCPDVECDNSELIELVNQLRRKLKMCGCGNNCCCDDNGVTIPPPENVDDNPVPEPVSSDVGDAVQNAEWCRRFSWFVAAWVGALGAVSQGAGLGIQVTGTWLQALLEIRLGGLAVWFSGVMSTFIAWLAGSTTWQGMFEALNKPDVLSSLVCAVFTADNPLQGKEQFKAVIRDEVVATWYQKMMINLWRSVINWNLMYSDSAWELLEGQFPQIATTPVNCPCGENPILPPPPPSPGGDDFIEVGGESGSWFLVPMNLHEPASQENATLTEEEFLVTWSTTAVTDITASSKMRSELLTSPVLDNSGSVYGIPTLHGGFMWLNLEQQNARLGAFSAEAAIVTGGSAPQLDELEAAFRIDTSFAGVTDQEILDKLESVLGIDPTKVLMARFDFSSSNNATWLRFRRGDSSTVNPQARGVVYALLHESVLDIP